MFSRLRYVVDLRHPLQAPCAGEHPSCGGAKRHISSRRGHGNVGILKGFPKRVGNRLHGFPYSVISMACFSRTVLDKALCRHQVHCRTRHEMLIDAHRLSLSAWVIRHSSRLRAKLSICPSCRLYGHLLPQEWPADRMRQAYLADAKVNLEVSEALLPTPGVGSAIVHVIAMLPKGIDEHDVVLRLAILRIE
jgi:hypothetical protein